MKALRVYLAVIVVLSALVVAMLVSLAASSGGARRWIDDRYEVVERTGDRSTVYRSDKSASTAIRQITDRWTPAARHNDSEGWYLRYDDSIVAVTISGSSALIYVDDPATGYRRWFTHIGGRFGSYSGPAESFRGGGPGSGK
jgi:hypothetical protein